jgi:hypothetical protein
MTVYFPPRRYEVTLGGSLDEANTLLLCSRKPTSCADALTVALGNKLLERKATLPATRGGTVTGDGRATHFAGVDSANERCRCFETCLHVRALACVNSRLASGGSPSVGCPVGRFAPNHPLRRRLGPAGQTTANHPIIRGLLGRATNRGTVASVPALSGHSGCLRRTTTSNEEHESGCGRASGPRDETGLSSIPSSTGAASAA